MIGGKVISIGVQTTLADLLAKGVKVQRVGDVMMVAARAVDGQLKKHFRGKNQQPNKNGFPKQHFWAQIRDAVQTYRDGDDGAVVQVNDPRLNTHVFGATITPKEKKLLAIPVHPTAYGRRASTFDDLDFIPRKKGGGGHVSGFLTKPGAAGALEFYYILMTQTVVPADPDALPSDGDMTNAAGRAVQLWITRQVTT